jgi:hypothetical protein
MSFRDIFTWNPTTGHKSVVVSTLKRRISAYTRDCDKFYIGLTSNGYSGCGQRWHKKYKPMGYTRMIAVYSTESVKYAQNIEKELIEFYIEHSENQYAGTDNVMLNRLDPRVVYIAVKD